MYRPSKLYWTASYDSVELASLYLSSSSNNNNNRPGRLTFSSLKRRRTTSQNLCEFPAAHRVAAARHPPGRYSCRYVATFCPSLNVIHRTSPANRVPCGAGAPLFPPCPFTSSSFPLFTFPFLSLALPIFFFCPSLAFLPE